MKPLTKIRIWFAAHSKFMDALRIALGLVFIWKGIFFILNLGILHLVLKDTGIEDTLGLAILIQLLAQFIIILNLLGGFCITFNLHTRFFCWLNLPVLFGAVFFINMHRGTFTPHAEFWLSLFALLAIVSILIVPRNQPIISQHEAEIA